MIFDQYGNRIKDPDELTLGGVLLTVAMFATTFGLIAINPLFGLMFFVAFFAGLFVYIAMS